MAFDQKQYHKQYCRKNAKRLKAQNAVSAQRRRAAMSEEEYVAYRAHKNMKSREYYERNKQAERDRSERYRQNNMDKFRERHETRRAKLVDQFVENVDRMILYERDEGICGICDHPVDVEDFWVDHIIPISKGGEHSYANTQVSHSLCNLKKGCS